MIDRQQIQKNLKDLFSFFGKYIILVFNAKKRCTYIKHHSSISMIIYITTFIITITIILCSLSRIYQITKPLPLIYIPIHTIIFGGIYLVPLVVIIRDDKLSKQLKQMIFSALLSSSFFCTLFAIIYSIFIISESYILYYSMNVGIILICIFHYILLILKYKQSVSCLHGRYICILKVVKPILIFVYIYCVLNLVFLCQFNFIYKGKTFVYTFDPIYQEMLDNMQDRQEILKYILSNTELEMQFMQDVIIEQKTNKYGLLIQQIDTIVNKEPDLKKIYEKLLFNRNRVIYEYILSYISISKYIKTELNRLQFVGVTDITAVQHELESDMNQLQTDVDKLSKLKAIIESQNIEQSMINDMNIYEEMKSVQESLDNIQMKQGRYDYVLSQAAINHLVIPEISKLVEKQNEFAERIQEEFNREEKIFKIKEAVWL